MRAGSFFRAPCTSGAPCDDWWVELGGPGQCPECEGPLKQPDAGTGGRWCCQEGHEFTTLELTQATAQSAVRAVWAGVRALEDHAAGLTYLSRETGQEQYGTQADDARRQAQVLRDLAATMEARPSGGAVPGGGHDEGPTASASRPA